MAERRPSRRDTALPRSSPVLSPPERYRASKLASTHHEQLVTVESQRELDLLTGERVERTFVKLYVAARRSGLLAAISDRDWKTLCTLATYMDADGYCFPSQAELARAMGCSRQMANERIHNLAAFRFQGQAVLLVVKGQRSTQGTWTHNGYRVLPIARLRIYDQPAPHTRRKNTTRPAPQTVSRALDTAPPRPAPVSSSTDTVRLDTTKNHPREPEPTLSKGRRVEQEPHSPGSVPAPVPAGASMVPAGMAHIGALVAQRSQPRHVTAGDDDYQVLQAYLAEIGRELGDRAPLRSSTTRAYRLFKRAGVSRAVMIARLFEARAILRDRATTVPDQRDPRFRPVPTRNRAAYFFAVLADLLGLRPS